MALYEDAQEMISLKQSKNLLRELSASEEIHSLMAPKYTSHTKEVKRMLREIFDTDHDYLLQHSRRDYANSKNPDIQKEIKERHMGRYANIIIDADGILSDYPIK